MSLFSITNIHEPGTTEMLEYSITEWLKEGLLEGGAFMNVAAGPLKESPRPGITSKTVFQTPRTNWIWESGVNYPTPPVRASGVYVNGAFRAFGSGCVPDYPGGSVTFSPALTGSPTVTMNYAARTVQTYNPRNAPWYYTTQWDSYDSNQAGSGTWSPDGRNRVQLPAVFIQGVTRVGRFEGYELGSQKRIHRQDVIFEILADLPGDRDRLHDALVSQWQTRFNGIDQRNVLRGNRQPLTAVGNLNTSGVGGYVNLASVFPWAQLRVCNVDSSDPDAGVEKPNPRLFRSVVKWTVESDLPFGS